MLQLLLRNRWPLLPSFIEFLDVRKIRLISNVAMYAILQCMQYCDVCIVLMYAILQCIHYCYVCIILMYAVLQCMHYINVCNIAMYGLLQYMHYCSVSISILCQMLIFHILCRPTHVKFALESYVVFIYPTIGCIIISI